MLLQPTLLMSAFVVCLILSSRSNNIPVTDTNQAPPSKTTQQKTVPEDSLMVSEYEPVKKPVKLTPPVVTNHARIITSKGTMIVELYGKDAPKTVANFVKLSKNNFYKNLTFHRVETSPEFRLIQGGDPNGNGTGGSKTTVPLEISPKLRHWKGALAMARAQDRDSASCQFYICINPIHQLDDNYAVFGKVIKNIEVADKIKVGDKIKNIEIY